MNIGDKAFHTWTMKSLTILDKRNSIGSNDVGEYDYLININDSNEWINGGNLIKTS